MLLKHLHLSRLLELRNSRRVKRQKESTLVKQCLFSDLETYLTDVLKGENLSKKAKEKRDAFIKRIKDVKTRYRGMYSCNYYLTSL